MKKRTPEKTRLICAAFASALLLLALLLWQGLRRGDAVRVGIPRSVSAYGAGMLLQTPSGQYTALLGSTPQALLGALRSGDLDAALLPLSLARQAEGIQIRAVLGYETLVAVGGERVGSLRELEGRTLTLAEGLRASRAEKMLRVLLREADVDCTVVYGTAEGAALYCCDIDEAAALLASREEGDICFSFSRAWRREVGDWPPAGLCLAVRQDYLQRAGSDYAAFERALQSAVSYGADKRKKTVAMAAAAGLSDSEEMADRLYPYCDFCFLTGSEMQSALNALPE